MDEKMTIMIVDDEESLQFTFKSFLSRRGHEVMTAWNCPSEWWRTRLR